MKEMRVSPFQLLRACFIRWRCTASIWSLTIFSTAMLFISKPAMSTDEKIFRTGFMVEGGCFSVSPDGDKLLFNTKKLTHGMSLLDLKTGKITTVQSESGRYWEMPRWSIDGKNIAAISTAVVNNTYIVGDMQVILIDSHNWAYRTITSNQGVHTYPILSANGDKVYYFKGKARSKGRTPASGFDLFSSDVNSGSEEKLTDESFYQAVTGDIDDSLRQLLIYGIGTNRFGDLKNIYGSTSGFNIFSFDIYINELSLVPIKNLGKISEFSVPRVDKYGRLYFKGAINGSKGFVWSIFRVGRKGESPEKIIELPIWGEVDVSRRTGEIYVSDVLHGELIFRRLAVSANK